MTEEKDHSRQKLTLDEITDLIFYHKGIHLSEPLKGIVKNILKGQAMPTPNTPKIEQSVRYISTQTKIDFDILDRIFAADLTEEQQNHLQEKKVERFYSQPPGKQKSAFKQLIQDAEKELNDALKLVDTNKDDSTMHEATFAELSVAEV